MGPCAACGYTRFCAGSCGPRIERQRQELKSRGYWTRSMVWRWRRQTELRKEHVDEELWALYDYSICVRLSYASPRDYHMQTHEWWLPGWVFSLIRERTLDEATIREVAADEQLRNAFILEYDLSQH